MNLHHSLVNALAGLLAQVLGGPTARRRLHIQSVLLPGEVAR